MKKYVTAVVFLIVGVASAPAQMPNSEQLEMAYNAGRNQSGILSYCKDKGYTDGAALDVQAKVMALIPVPSDTSKGDAAEKSGTEGKISAMGIEQDLEATAKAQGMDIAKLCEQMADAVKHAGSALPK